MQAVLISIHPGWCKEIFAFLGYDNRRPLYKKRLELRKNAPKSTPFKCYIYCTKGNIDLVPSKIWWKKDRTGFENILNGMVIAEFTCDYIVRHCEMSNADLAEEMSCVSREDILRYSNGREVVGWHISDLKIYDKPRELSEFSKYGFGHPVPLKRPPQSWMYVEVADE